VQFGAVQPRPNRELLSQVAERMDWANLQVEALRRQSVGSEAATEWLGAQECLDRVAVACAALGLPPDKLPGFLQQELPANEARHGLPYEPLTWQPLVFMKFCIGNSEFSAHDVDRWARVAMPGCRYTDDETKSLNGFTRTAAALHHFLLQLEVQHVLCWTRYTPAPQDVTFTPRFSTARRFREFVKANEEAAARRAMPQVSESEKAQQVRERLKSWRCTFEPEKQAAATEPSDQDRRFPVPR
jgi:hypothetical protein